MIRSSDASTEEISEHFAVPCTMPVNKHSVDLVLTLLFTARSDVVDFFLYPILGRRRTLQRPGSVFESSKSDDLWFIDRANEAERIRAKPY